jgi:hypothetical protein
MRFLTSARERLGAAARALLITILCSSTANARDPAQGQSAAGCGSRLPHFDRELLLESTSETSANVSIGDLTGNGNLDIVLAK